MKMDPQFDVMDILDESVMDMLLEKNLSAEQKESVLDQLCRRNESSTPDESALDKILAENALEEHSSLIESAPDEVLKEIHQDMAQDDGHWHNQEYAMAEVERRLIVKMDKENQ